MLVPVYQHSVNNSINQSILSVLYTGNYAAWRMLIQQSKKIKSHACQFIFQNIARRKPCEKKITIEFDIARMNLKVLSQTNGDFNLNEVIIWNR